MRTNNKFIIYFHSGLFVFFFVHDEKSALKIFFIFKFEDKIKDKI